VEYRGDSPGKCIARMKFWRDRNAKVLSQPGRKIAVLASEFGGDVSVLLGLGIPPKNILAIDRDRNALDRFKSNFPDVPTACGDVAEVLEKHSCKFDVVFLDFLGNLSDNILGTAADVMKQIKFGGVLGVATLKGRESNRGKGFWCNDVTQSRKDKINFGKERSCIDNIGDGNYSDIVSADNNKDKLTARFASMWFALCQCVQGRHVEPMSMIIYQSKTKKSNGSPMLISTFRVLKRHLATSDYRNGNALSRFRKHPKEGTPIHDYTFVDDEHLRDFCLENDDIENLHMLLNIPKMRIAAWKAHQTMGTYI